MIICNIIYSHISTISMYVYSVKVCKGLNKTQSNQFIKFHFFKFERKFCFSSKFSRYFSGMKNLISESANIPQK